MKVLIVDDNAAVRSTLKLLLSKEFDEVAAVGDPKLIPALLRPENAQQGTGMSSNSKQSARMSSNSKQGNVDVVLLDMNFDNTKLDCSDGLFWLERIKSSGQAPAVVVITAFGDVDVAVKAMKIGAEDFITKPWDNDVLIEKLNNAVKINRQRRRDESAAKRVKEMEADLQAREYMTLDEVKLKHIRSVIERCRGNLSAASEQLGVNRQTLYNLMKKL